MSAMFALLCVFLSSITYVPGPGETETVIELGSAAASILCIVVALWLRRFPRTHWIHKSKPLWVGCVVIAVALTLIVMVIG